MSKYHTLTQSEPVVYLPMKAGFNGKQIEIAVLESSILNGASVKFDRVYPIASNNDAVANYTANHYAPIIISLEQSQDIEISSPSAGLGQFGLAGDGWLRAYMLNGDANTVVQIYISLN
tara:strand:- start:11531 stop:11887 length:357 start_codon:yes stop_codon:yes gene_type:complete